MSGKGKHNFLISLGSNKGAEQHIGSALLYLRQSLEIALESDIMQTEPVDFPYPSGLFTNVLLWGCTCYDKEKVQKILDCLEQRAGRDRTQRAEITLDADLIIWDRVLLKKQDLQRPYFHPYLDKCIYDRNI